MREIDVVQLDEALRNGAALVDVREPFEYADGHVPGAVSIPMGRLNGRLAELDPTSPVHLVCATGNRSSAMCELLRAGGFEAVNVAGGTSAWIRSGRPVVGGAR